MWRGESSRPALHKPSSISASMACWPCGARQPPTERFKRGFRHLRRIAVVVTMAAWPIGACFRAIGNSFSVLTVQGIFTEMTPLGPPVPRPMIKSELVQHIAEHNPHLYQRDVENIVNAILDEIVAALARGDRVELRGFGAFSVKHRPARAGRNPRTGAHEPVDQKIVPFFKTGKEMRERLNRDGESVDAGA